mmetsp:Transcript_66253/g.149572  ORF Transcript_66253/g.149572 Transcript_66253/m.149572 type:complete len:255 (-) Transcript_66253:2029-2793(-)
MSCTSPTFRTATSSAGAAPFTAPLPSRSPTTAHACSAARRASLHRACPAKLLASIRARTDPRRSACARSSPMALARRFSSCSSRASSRSTNDCAESTLRAASSTALWAAAGPASSHCSTEASTFFRAKPRARSAAIICSVRASTAPMGLSSPRPKASTPRAAPARACRAWEPHQQMSCHCASSWIRRWSDREQKAPTTSHTSEKRACKSSKRRCSCAMLWWAAFTRFTCRRASSSSAWHLSLAACTDGGGLEGA